jgi:hypothetical protein
MAEPTITREQKEELDKHIGGIGHNQGPALLAHAEEIQRQVAKHHHLRTEATRIRVLFDMLRSHVDREYPMPTGTTSYVIAGIGLVATMTGAAVATRQPIAALLLDAPVIATTIEALGGEMQEYVNWRAARDPSYQAIKQELYG